MEKPLYIPKNKRWKGLTVFCKKCRVNVSEICKETGKLLQRCPYGAEKHVFKQYVFVPGKQNERRTKTFTSRDLNEVLLEAIVFEKQVKENIPETPEPQKEVVVKEEINRPQLLTHALARYVGFLNGEDVPAFRRRQRSPAYVREVELALERLALCWKHTGHDMSTLQVEDIDEKMVGEAYEYLEKTGFANKTFNKNVSVYTSFLDWYSQEYNRPVRNFFKQITRRSVNPRPKSITENEYDALLTMITHENGAKEYADGKKPQRNRYRPWLADAFRLGIETGARREELLHIKFSDIKQTDDGFDYIEIEDRKTNRIKARTREEDKKYRPVPITASLRQLLEKLELEKYEGTDTYMLAPEVTENRTKAMSDALSKGFSHYYKLLNTGRTLSFKSLRKTFVTKMSLYMGPDAIVITGHSTQGVKEKFYLDKEVIAKAAKGFKMFSEQPTRQQELAQIRNKQNGLEKIIEK